MLDFDLLYKKIFKEEDGLFNTQGSYYPILINCSDNSDRFTKICERISLYMFDNCYYLINSNQITETGFRYHLINLNDKFCDVVSRQFVFILDFTQDSSDVVIKNMYLNDFYAQKEQSDTFVHIVLLPDNEDEACAILKKLESIISDNDIVCIFNVSDYHNNLIENICGSIVYLSSKERVSNLVSKYNKQSLSNVIRDYGEQTQQILNDKKAILWTVINASFYNPKRDYLRKYISEMCKKVKACTYEDYKRVCEKLYNEKVKTNNNEAIETLLKTTISRIPTIEKFNNKDIGGSLSTYFSRLFGFNGTEVVKLSFEVTLAMQDNKASEAILSDVAKALFDKTKVYHNLDMRKSVLDFIKKYISEIKQSLAHERQNLTRFLEIIDDNGDYYYLRDKYIREYAEYYAQQMKLDFWIQIEDLLDQKKDFASQQCIESKKLYDDLSELKLSFAYEKNNSYEIDGVLACTAADIINISERQDICDTIERTFVMPSESHKTTSFCDIRKLCTIEFVPNFYWISKEEFRTEKGSFGVNIDKMTGRYLYFLKECK